MKSNAPVRAENGTERLRRIAAVTLPSVPRLSDEPTDAERRAHAEQLTQALADTLAVVHESLPEIVRSFGAVQQSLDGIAQRLESVERAGRRRRRETRKTLATVEVVENHMVEVRTAVAGLAALVASKLNPPTNAATHPTRAPEPGDIEPTPSGESR